MNIKRLAPIIALTISLFALQIPLFGQTKPTEKGEAHPTQYIATIKRSTSGRQLDERGFGSGSVPLHSGMTYLVEKNDMGTVTIQDGDVLIRVNKSDVDLTVDDGSASEGGFFRIVSANYRATTGGKRYSVKQEILKRIPKGRITQPIKILIDDHLLACSKKTVGESRFGKFSKCMIQSDFSGVSGPKPVASF